MPVQIPNHAHCTICARAIAFGDKTCSKECAAKWEDLQGRRKRTMYLMYVLLALGFGVMMLTYVAPGLLGG